MNKGKQFIFLRIIVIFVLITTYALETHKLMDHQAVIDQDLANRLWQSIEQHDFKGIRDALKSGAEVVKYRSSSEQITALEYAVKQHDIQLLRFLLQEAAKSSPGYNLVNNTLFIETLKQWRQSHTQALQQQNKRIILLLVLHGAQLSPYNKDHREIRCLYQEEYANPQKLLYAAIREGLTSLARIALKNGARLEQTTTDTSGNIYAHVEASVGDKLYTQEILAQELDVATFFTPLELAARSDHEHIVRFLLEHGAHYDKEKVCSIARRYCYHDILALLG